MNGPRIRSHLPAVAVLLFLVGACGNPNVDNAGADIAGESGDVTLLEVTSDADVVPPLCDCRTPDAGACHECQGEEADVCLDGWTIWKCVHYVHAKAACMDTFDCFNSGPPGACTFEAERFGCIHCDYPWDECSADADCASSLPDCPAERLRCERAPYTCTLDPWGEPTWRDEATYGRCECQP